MKWTPPANGQDLLFEKTGSQSWHVQAFNYGATLSSQGISIPLPRGEFKLNFGGGNSIKAARPAARLENRRLLVPEVLPGVDVVYHDGGGRNMEFDFLVAPGVEASALRMKWSGAAGVRAEPGGGLRFSSGVVDVELARPAAWQEQNGERVYVAAAYRLNGDGTAGFELGSYNRDLPLCIDPTVLVRVPLQPSPSPLDQSMEAAGSAARALAFSPQDGSVYLGGRNRAWLAKYNASTDARFFRTTLGRDARDSVQAIAVDPAGAVHVAGSVWVQGAEKGFSAELSASGEIRRFTSLPQPVRALAMGPAGAVYLAGDKFIQLEEGWNLSVPESVLALAVDSKGRIYAAGRGPAGAGGFVARVAADGTGWDWIQPLSGSGALNEAATLAIGPGGSLYVAGSTNSQDFPVKAPFQSRLSGAQDAFAARVAADGSGLAWATYFGGTGATTASAAMVDRDGNLMLTGATTIPDLPLAQSGGRGESGFFARFDAGGQLLDCAYAGVAGTSRFFALASAPDGQPYVAGSSMQTTETELLAKAPLPASALNAAPTSSVSGSRPASVSSGGFNGEIRGSVAEVTLSGSLTTLTTSPNPSAFGQSAKLTATVSPASATGFVTFYDDATVLGSSPLNAGTAVLNSIQLPAGKRSLHALYGGDPANAPSRSSPVEQTVLTLPSVGFVTGRGGPTLPDGLSPAMLVADFNGDGKADIVFARSEEGTVTVLVNNPMGAFGGFFTPVTSGPYPFGKLGLILLATGDFNADGKPDLAVASADSADFVTILLGDGNGGFTIAGGGPYPVGPGVSAIAVGDFNGDGKADLASANGASNNVTVLLGDGAGGFHAAAGSPFATGATPASLVVADFNGDGMTDIAVPNFDDNNVTVLLGDGNGGFAPSIGSPFPVGLHPLALATGDFNGDGRVDLAVTNGVNSSAFIGTRGLPGNVTVLLGNGNGAFAQAAGSPFPVGVNPRSLVVGDFNGDGKSDLVIADYGASAPIPPLQSPPDLTLLLGNGRGGFTPGDGTPFAPFNVASIAAADFNGDHIEDLVVATSNTPVDVLLGLPKGVSIEPVVRPDNFNSLTLNWTFLNPAGDGSFSLNGSQLLLNVPAGSNHDPAFAGVNNSVRIAEAVSSNSDFTVDVKFDSIPSKQYQFEGVLVEQDAANYLRFQFGSTGSSLVVSASKILSHSETALLSHVIAIPAAATSLWLRIQRTGNIWTETWSANGVNYKLAGSFTQTLTVADVGPFAGNYNPAAGGAPAFTAKIDYLRNAGAPVPDDFNDPTLNADLWTFVKPAGGSFSLDGSDLTLKVPGSTNHDPAFGGTDHAVRIAQPFGPGDFTLEIKFDSIPSAQIQPGQFEFEGLIVEQNAGNYLRFQFGSTAGLLTVGASAIAAGQETTQFSPSIALPGGATSIWLRVQRAGDTWTETWSPDGIAYNTVGSFTHALKISEAGPFAGNYGTSPGAAPAFAARVDYFLVPLSK